jgi:hypothetical protein
MFKRDIINIVVLEVSATARVITAGYIIVAQLTLKIRRGIRYGHFHIAKRILHFIVVCAFFVELSVYVADDPQN